MTDEQPQKITVGEYLAKLYELCVEAGVALPYMPQVTGETTMHLASAAKYQNITSPNAGAEGPLGWAQIGYSRMDAKLNNREHMLGTAGIVTRMPGLMEFMGRAEHALRQAYPLLLIAGNVPAVQRKSGKTQEFDPQRMGEFFKEVVSIDSADGIEQKLLAAVKAMYNGTPGPVLFDVSSDILGKAIDAKFPTKDEIIKATKRQPNQPNPADIDKIFEIMQQGKYIMSVGAMAEFECAQEAVSKFANAAKCPTNTTVRRQSEHAVIDDNQQSFNPASLQQYDSTQKAYAEAKTVILGGDFARTELQKQLNSFFKPGEAEKSNIIIILPDTSRITKHENHQIMQLKERGCNVVLVDADLKPTLNALSEKMAAQNYSPSDEQQDFADRIHQESMKEREIPKTREEMNNEPGQVALGEIIRQINESDQYAAIVTGAGTYTGAGQKHADFEKTVQLSPPDGYMGAFNEAIGAAHALVRGGNPDNKRIAVFIGDGGAKLGNIKNFLDMAAEHNLPLDIHICDDGKYSAIENTAKRSSPATRFDAINPRQFHGYGIPVARVTKTTDYDQGFAQGYIIPTIIKTIQVVEKAIGRIRYGERDYIPQDIKNIRDHDISNGPRIFHLDMTRRKSHDNVKDWKTLEQARENGQHVIIR